MKKETQHSESYINHLVGGKSGFVQPANYFADFEENFYSSLLRKSISKTEGYAVPDAYFENFEDKILSEVSENKSKVISLNKIIQRWAPLAAAAIIVIALVFNLELSTSSEISNEEIVSWFERDYSRISNEDLITAFDDIDLNQINFSTNTISEDEIENYLLNNNLNSLFEE